MSSAVRGSSRVAVLCVLGFTALIVACGGGATSDGCDQSSREEPRSNIYLTSCKNWDLRIGLATAVPNDVILQANMFNDVSDFKSWIVVEANLKYKGSGTGRVSDAISSSAFLVGSKNLLYVANDETPTFSELKDEFAPVPFDAPSPYSGGTVTISMWFWVDNDDSEFVLGLFVDDKDADEPNLWIDVYDEPEEEIIEEVPSEDVDYGPCYPYFRMVDGYFVSPDSDLRYCDFSYQDWSYFSWDGRNLTGTSFVGANLTGAYLMDAYLTDANLTDANLTDANLTDANLTDANLTNANLTGANLYLANVDGAIFSGAIFAGTTMPDGTVKN